MKLEFPFDEVEGLLSHDDKLCLKSLSEQCASLDGDVVEIGSYYGLSSCILRAFSSPKATLHCFDFFEPEKFSKFALFANDMTGIRGLVQCHCGNFKGKISEFPARIAFAFVDHDHTFESTKLAFEAIWPRLTAGGIISFHDFKHPDYPGGTKYMLSIPFQPLPQFQESAVITFQKPR